MRIRRGNLEDLDLIYALERESFPEEAWPRYVFEDDMRRSQSIYLIAEENDDEVVDEVVDEDQTVAMAV